MLVALFGLTFGCEVRLYEHSHTTEGKKCTIGEGVFLNLNSATAQNMGCPGTNEISRVKLTGYCYVDMYHQTNYGGVHERIWESGNYVQGGAFQNDVIDSIKTSYSACYPEYPVNGVCKKCRVTFSQHASNYVSQMGRWCEKGIDYSTFYSGAGVNTAGGCPGPNQISRVKIEGNCHVHMWEQSGYNGQGWVLQGPGTWTASFQNSDGPFENDEVSSFQIKTGSGRRRDGEEYTENTIFLKSDEERGIVEDGLNKDDPNRYHKELPPPGEDDEETHERQVKAEQQDAKPAASTREEAIKRLIAEIRNLPAAPSQEPQDP